MMGARSTAVKFDELAPGSATEAVEATALGGV
jgi:hypothetical protein